MRVHVHEAERAEGRLRRRVTQLGKVLGELVPVMAHRAGYRHQLCHLLLAHGLLDLLEALLLAVELGEVGDQVDRKIGELGPLGREPVEARVHAGLGEGLGPGLHRRLELGHILGLDPVPVHEAVGRGLLLGPLVLVGGERREGHRQYEGRESRPQPDGGRHRFAPSREFNGSGMSTTGAGRGQAGSTPRSAPAPRRGCPRARPPCAGDGCES